jgi:hypothetical protein
MNKIQIQTIKNKKKRIKSQGIASPVWNQREEYQMTCNFKMQLFQSGHLLAARNSNEEEKKLHRTWQLT